MWRAERSGFAVRGFTALWVITGLRLSAQSEPNGRRPISVAVIAAALRSDGLDVEPSQIHLPMSLSSASASPELEVLATERLSRNRIGLLLRCRKAGDCVPFHATVELANDSDDAVLSAVQGHRLKAQMQRKDDEANASAAPVSMEDNRQLETSSPVRVGYRVVLLMRDGHLRIQLPVIAVDSGAIGAEIRVCTMDRKKIFHATVLDKNTVEGRVQ